MTLLRLDLVRGRSNNGRVDEDYKYAAVRVRAWRKRHDADGRLLVDPLHDEHMSQARFAELAGVSVGCFQGVEAGLRRTRKENLAKIARVMDLTLDDLTAPLPAQPEAAPGTPDPRFEGLLPDDLDVARLYQRADGPLKTTIKRMLTEYHQRARAQLQSKEALRSPSEAPFRDERRSGIDRRGANGQDAAPSERRRVTGE